MQGITRSIHIRNKAGLWLILDPPKPRPGRWAPAGCRGPKTVRHRLPATLRSQLLGLQALIHFCGIATLDKPVQNIGQLVRGFLELVGERAGELGLKDRALGLDEAAKLLRERDFFDVRAAFVDPDGRFFELVVGTFVQLGPLRGFYEGHA